MRRGGLLLAAIVASSTLTVAETFVETFEGGSNEGQWTYGGPSEFIDPSGGNPGAFLNSGTAAPLDTFAPILRTTTTSSVFTGDYRASGVTAVGCDLIQLLSTTTTGGRPLTAMLVYDNGTPSDPFDDTAAYFLGPNIPDFGDGWISYDFDVPSQSTSLPPGWVLLNLGDIGAPPIHDWDTVIQNVSRLQFHYGNPEFVFIFQQWIIGADNIRITAEAGECGDNEVGPGETCDPPGKAAGGNGNDCRDDCTVCGDGMVNGPSGAEECDDGNGVDGDGCDNDCTITLDFCGNAMVEAGETCDPPGTPAGDNGNDCRDDCTVCGDGQVNGPSGAEECDDGNGVDGDGCDNDCSVSGGAVPAVSTLGLMLLVLALLGLGTLALRRRRTA